MPIQVTLSDNERIQVDVSLADWSNAYQRAVQGDTMVEIEEPDGRVVSINPHRVILVEAAAPPREPVA
jgi:hypothetical protein